MKKAFIAVALLLPFAENEWNGYAWFDRADGTNLLAEIDPNCRSLTDGEIVLARSIFSDEIDYTNIKVFNRKYMILGGAYGSTKAMAPNGNLYLTHELTQIDDYAKGSRSHKALFIHEMTHVWQHQNGKSMQGNAVFEWVRHSFNYCSAYPYDLDKVRDFNDLNFEQQAKFIEDYYKMKSMQQPLPASNSASNQTHYVAYPHPPSHQKIAAFEKILQPHFPIFSSHPKPYLLAHSYR